MSVSAPTARLAAATARGAGDRLLLLGLSAFAGYHLALAVFMTFTPHAFFTSIGPFDAYNRHYILDTASFEAAFAVGFAAAVLRPAWRVPVLAVATVQFALHTLNHLADAGEAHPAWTGWFDFAGLLAATALLAALLARTRAETPVRPERSIR